MIKRIAIISSLLGLPIGAFIGFTHHYGLWIIGTTIAGGIIGFFSGAELGGYIEMIQNRIQKKQ